MGSPAPPTVGAAEFHDRIADQWDGNYRKRSFSSRLVSLDACLDGVELNGGRWLDAGCGTGTLSRVLASRGAHVLGIDAAPNMVRQAEAAAEAAGLTERTEFRKIETLERLDFEDAGFDGVLCSSVLEYLDRPEDALAHLARVLCPGGRLVVSVPNSSSLQRMAQRLMFRTTGKPAFMAISKNDYSVAAFRRLLDRYELDVVAALHLGGPVPLSLQRRSLIGALTMFAAEKRKTA